MNPDSRVTLAIHTYRRALDLQRRLQDAGIKALLCNVDDENPALYPGVRVRVALSDLSKALHFVETEPERELANATMKLAGMSPTLLIPVDFSTHSDLAVKMGFDLADRLALEPLLLHAVITPYFRGTLSDLNSVSGIEQADDLQEAQLGSDLSGMAKKQMSALRRRIDRRIADGDLPAIKFRTELREGIPEEVIAQYIRQTPPAFVVMATRGASRRSEELVGSVTAEVLDSCRVPMFIVPENQSLPPVRDIDKVVFFCNLDQQDILTMDMFQRTFDYPDCTIYMVPVNERAGAAVSAKIKTLEEYFTANYSSSKFISLPLDLKRSFRPSLENAMEQNGIQLIVVPNRRRNILSRIFNPSVAHRLLFEKDVPMFVFPS